MGNFWRLWSFSDAPEPAAPAPAGSAPAAPADPAQAGKTASLVPRAWFGTATAPLPDPAEGDEPDPDDEELPETPEDVIAMLGFDPKEAEADDAADAADTEGDEDA